MIIKRSLVLLFCIGMIFISCKKDHYITSGDASVATSVDTLFFDTVFTSVGSVTKSFKISNPNDQKIKLSKVKLMGGSASFFKLNIDGISGNESDDIDVAAHDSIYVFVQVNAIANNATLPFVISDSVLINYNGNNRYVQLQAYGQNANFIKRKLITGNQVWNNALPYVIIGGMQVDASATLTINKGTHIYCHADAPIVIDGSLVINGTKAEPVIFKGDRLDPDYKTLPAGWPGIFYRKGSKNNVMGFAQILNAYQAVVVQDPSVNAAPKLVISQTIIDNAYNVGLIADHSFVEVDNSLISNCGNNVILEGGGNYKFINCTIASYSNFFVTHKSPVFMITDVSNQVANDLNANIINSIFWGDDGIVKNEVVVTKQSNKNFTVSFDHDLMRLTNDPANSMLTSVIKNQDPLFDSINVGKRYFDFHINRNNSPAIHSGTSTLYLKDLDDKDRINGVTDLGCYQK